MTQPLDGIVVADFTHVMAGPYATHLLRLLGAEVIKVEAPGRGDAMRYYGADRRYDGMAPAFISVNAGKKSIELDLKDHDDCKVARELVARADVMIENFRPGVIERLGFGYDAVKALNPTIVYCSVSGYGQDGPYRDWPAIDNIVQATSGMMSLGGSPEDPPMRVGFPVVDTLTGQTAALSILSALFRRERQGEGEFIDVAMLDATLAFMTSAIGPYLITGTPLQRTGNVGYSGQPTAGMFETADGRTVSLGIVQQAQFVKLAHFFDRRDWLEEPFFLTPDLRREHADLVRQAVGTEIAKWKAEELERELSAAGLPCGMVRSVSEAAEFNHLDQRNIKLPLDMDALPGDPAPQIMNAGFCMSHDGPGVKEPPPRLGEHSDEIRKWLGF